MPPEKPIFAFLVADGNTYESIADKGLVVLEDLPALRDGSTWIGGFRNILDYVRQYSHGQWDLDADLEPQEQADCIAYGARTLAAYLC